jgi:hypothetical protein
MCKLCLAIALLFAIVAGTILGNTPDYPGSDVAAQRGDRVAMN